MQKKKTGKTSLDRARIAIPQRSKQEFEELVSEDKEMPTATTLKKQDSMFMKEAKSMGHLLAKLKQITGITSGSKRRKH